MLKLSLALLVLLFSAAWGYSPLSGFNGARPQALGNAYAGLGDDAYAFYINPAGLSELNKQTFFSTYSQLDSNNIFTSLGLVSPNTWLGGVAGVSYRRQSLTGLQSDESFDTQELGLALAREIGGGLSIGAVLRYFNQGNGFAAGQAVDLGVRRVYQPWLWLGLALQDLGGSLRYQDGTAANLPSNLIAGGTLVILGREGLIRRDQQLLLSLDMSQNRNDPPLLHAGLEWQPAEPIAFRAGVDQSFGVAGETVFTNTIFNNLTAGLGFRYGGVALDYAMRRNGDVTGDVTNYLSCSYVFTEPAGPAAEETTTPAEPVKTVSAEVALAEPAVSSARKAKLRHFPDVPKNFWAREQIELLATAGLMWGYTDGKFHPQGRVTRGALEIILSVGQHVNALRVSDEDRPVTRAEAAKRLKLKAPLERPSQPLTRAELAMMIYQTSWAQAALKRLPELEE